MLRRDEAFADLANDELLAEITEAHGRNQELNAQIKQLSAERRRVSEDLRLGTTELQRRVEEGSIDLGALARAGE